jgi:ribonuclease P protein component
MNTYLIKKKEDFAHVFRNGSFLSCSSFTINYAKKSKAVNINLPRFGIVASKKVGNAVQRNFAKRRTKALKNSFLNCGKNEFDYILVAKKNLLYENFKILSSQLEQTLNKIKAL